MIRELDFIRTGETWAIAGESDSGHSALLQLIETKDMERVSFRHHFRNLSNTTDFYYQQRFNSSDSEDALIVRDHLLHERKTDGYWTIEHVIERLSLGPLLDEQVIKLSNGETKRVLIAAALLRNPKILLLDHPLTGLDVSTRAAFDDLIAEITVSGIIVIMATGPSDIPSSVSHVAVMRAGKIIHHGEKASFRPADFGFVHEVKIDHVKLKELIHAHRPGNFNTVVGMKDVTIRYDNKIILNQINWTVKQAERWSLTGPNGAGKSTLLSLINGDNPQAYANDIVLFDRKRGSGESIWDIKKEIGFVSPELYQYFPTDSSCLQVIESGFHDTVGLFRASDPLKAARAVQWMELMNVAKYANVLFNRVPPAIQRLCLLARALVKMPALLILDEPTQGLDQNQQMFFTKLIDLICLHSRVTLIYVSHYRDHIPPAVTHHLQLKNGSVDKKAGLL